MNKLIMNEIKKSGFFLFSPDKWDKYGKIVSRLEKENKIESLYNAGYDDWNTGYIYVLKGDPNKVRYIEDKKERGLYNLQKTIS